MIMENKVNKSSFNWFPGHMKKASVKVEELQKNLDFIIMILDARVPLSSYNTFLFDLINNKPKLIIFTKCDLADDKKTNKWIEYYKNQGFFTIRLEYNSKNKKKIILQELNNVCKAKREKNLRRGIKNSIFKGIVLGIPNVGKSTLINTLSGKNLVKAADTPGVTRNVNWLKVSNEYYIYDTPGILQPHFENKDIGCKLALIGSIRQDILPLDELVNYLLDFLKINYKLELDGYLKIDSNIPNEKIIEHIAKTRVALLKDGLLNFDGAIRLLLIDFKDSKIGKTTLDII